MFISITLRAEDLEARVCELTFYLAIGKPE